MGPIGLRLGGSRKPNAEQKDGLSGQSVSTTSTMGAGLGQVVRGASIQRGERLHDA